MKVMIDYFVDQEENVVVGTSSDIGLVTEAPALDELRQKAAVMAADLLGVDSASIELTVRPAGKDI